MPSDEIKEIPVDAEGFPVDANGLNEKQFLAQYNPGDYPRPSVTADIVVFTTADVWEDDNHRKRPQKELRILLIRRGGHPYIGHWALPGGFVNPDETVGEAARRELEEETGIRSGFLEQLHTFSRPGRDPRTWIITCSHMALIDGSRVKVKAGDDAADARWFTLKVETEPAFIRLALTNEDLRIQAAVTREQGDAEIKTIENGGLAFDHGEMISLAIQRLREKLECLPLAFCLLPEQFTLTELQQVYEAILGKPLVKAAFRRKIKALVIASDEFRHEAGYKPARLFTKRNR